MILRYKYQINIKIMTRKVDYPEHPLYMNANFFLEAFKITLFPSMIIFIEK
jgi:hypothetical protein